MCGRFLMTRASGDRLSFFGAEDPSGLELRPNRNTAPTQDVPIVLERSEDGAPARQLGSARWGLAPSWAKDVKIGSRMINARSQTILEKPSFRSAAVKRRALIFWVLFPSVGNKKVCSVSENQKRYRLLCQGSERAFLPRNDGDFAGGAFLARKRHRCV